MKPAIRHAEKRRTSTCRFADRVAQLSVDHYKRVIPENDRPPQTCVAAIVAHDAIDGSLTVMGMGIGTKFLSQASLLLETSNNNDGTDVEKKGQGVYGRQVRDMHAEVLARRAFRRALTLQILDDLDGKSKLSPSNIVIRSSASPLPSSTNLFPGVDDKAGTTPRIRYKLRAGVTLHMYSSSVPCGNASLKKFCKMSKEQFRDDLGPNEWPNTLHDPPIGHSIKLGEFALLLKKDSSSNVRSEHRTPMFLEHSAEKHLAGTATKKPVDDNDTNSCKRRRHNKQNQPISQQGQEEPSQRKHKILWPANVSDDWTPPGTTIVGFKHKGSIHTCSDKICRWNYFGIQGSLLASLLEEPLYLSTLTVGRKLSGSVCQRAVCCRLNARSKPIVGITDIYRINHPAILGTAVYLDACGIVETSADIQGQDVRFHSPFTWAWWPEMDHKCKYTVVSGGVLECIDGSTGYLAATNVLKTLTVSQISTQALTRIFEQAYRVAAGKIPEDNTHEPKNSFTTLKELCRLKKLYSTTHEQIKETMLSKHRVLCDWNRRIDGIPHEMDVFNEESKEGVPLEISTESHDNIIHG